MSAPITQNWLTSFKTNLSCGHFPSKTSNPYMEMLTGMVGLQIEYLLCQCPTALDAPEVASANIQDSNRDSLLMWYNKIKCGEFFESDAQAWAVYAMALNKLVECCETDDAQELVHQATDSISLSENHFDTNDTQTLVLDSADAEDVTFPLNADVPLPLGSKIKIIQAGVGVVSAIGAGGVTVEGTTSTTAQWEALLVEKIGEDLWHSILLA